ncbi:SLC13 family permease [Mariniblastus sp.]|jgi:solute carrier family 13 (sodium-dependent dicarboxylate transporter), member 2/3/5|nr:SLC13 family permease [Mariniblastus sp.]MDB4756738.1 SLC13 family permease [Mariniblastus sp.]
MTDQFENHQLCESTGPRQDDDGAGVDHYWRDHLIWFGPVFSTLVAWLLFQGGFQKEQAITVGITLATAIWWVFEVLPFGVSSLLPLALFQLFGILNKKQIAECYGSHLVLLLFGGFVLSQALEKSGAHRRLAISMVAFCGGGGKRLILGFMLAAFFLSMWISNAATTLMMLPIALAVLENTKEKRATVPLLLGIAYAASCGGMATPIGTPPNLAFMQEFERATGNEMSFLSWMTYALPIALALLIPIWLWVSRDVSSEFRVEMPSTGRWRSDEIRTLIVFSLTALAWMTRKDPFGGWSGLPCFDYLVDGERISDFVTDGAVAFVAVIIMFCIPTGNKDGQKLLDWPTARRIPWEMLILVGAGIALGAAFRESGLSETIAGGLEHLDGIPALLLIFLLAILVSFLTEMTSNTATANLLMPILGAAAVKNNMEPGLLMFPAVISASCAFMLPVATIPNAVVFATGKIPIGRMAREGVVLNIGGALVVAIGCYFFLRF